MKWFMQKILCTLGFFWVGVGVPALAANTVIDVLVVYTPGTAAMYGGDPTTRINQLFQVTNQIYRDSGIRVELSVAKTMQVDYTDDNSASTALNDITYNSHIAFNGVAAARDQAKADMVIFYRPYKSIQGGCGVAWIGGQGSNGDFSNVRLKNYMFSHIAINSCGDFVTAHELGHNMGLRHSRKQDGTGGTFPHALGYGVVNQFTTIMAYQTDFNVDYWSGKQYKFSNPDLDCKGMPCGIPRTDLVNGADASHTLNVTAPQIAKFYTAIRSSAESSLALGRSSSSYSSSMAIKASSSTAVSKLSSSIKSSLKAVVATKNASSTGMKSSAKSQLLGKSSSRAGVASSAGKTNSSVKKSLSSAATSFKNIIFNRAADVAQFEGADWSNEVRREKGLSLSQAKAMAASNSNINYFFIIKNKQLSLGAKGVFHMGDTVFFSGKPWYGSAPGLADMYTKVQ